MYKIHPMTLLENKSADIPAPREITTKPRLSDKIFRGVVTSGGLSSLVILGLIFAFLFYQGFDIFRSQGIGFLTTSRWDVNFDEAGNITSSDFGLSAMLIGTIICAFTAVLIAVPISVATALYLSFYAPPIVKKFMVTVVDLMAAFPSILFGIWAYFVLMPSGAYWAKLLNKYFGFIPVFANEQRVFDSSPFIASLILAIMIIPIVTSISREVFSQAPLDRIQAAYALGATRWAMIRAVVIPHGRSGVIGGAMLGLGRAMGETVAVYTVLNLVFAINWKILFGVGGNVASLILLKFGEATPYEIKALMAAGLVLFVLTLLVNFSADLLVRRLGGKGK
jgi:phosphate transport system permease protein